MLEFAWIYGDGREIAKTVTSEVVINAGFPGEVKPMDDTLIDELIEAFLK